MSSRPGERSIDEIVSALGGSVPANSAVSEVAKRLLGYFTSGDIQPGTRLPPERQLAASLGVGRSAVREALAALDLLGVVHIRPGSGTYLRGSASELLPQTLSWGLMLGEQRTRELIELRHGLEVEAARLAAGRASDEHIARLGVCLGQMWDNMGDLAAFVEADRHFHLEVGEAAGNLVLRDLLQNVRSLLRVWAERVLRDEVLTRLTYDEHAAVFHAISDHDPARAGEAMAAHMNSAGVRLLHAFETTAPGAAEPPRVNRLSTTA
jgi:GntR family transcriptional regulator, transcriptional repressor for pyruvate dehydrogenase complex